MSLGLGLVLLALLVRVGAVLATPGYVPRHDDRDYDRLGCWVAEHGFPPRAAVVGAWELWAIMLLAVAGLASGAARRAPVALLALPEMVWLTTVPIQSETPRFRAPLDPFLLMLAALGAAAACAALRRR